MVGRLLFRGKMRSRLRLEKLSEGRVVNLAAESGLVADRLQSKMEEPSWAPFGAGARLAPGLLERGSIELQVEAKIVGDGEGRSLIEISDEVSRDRGVAGILTHRLLNRLGLLVYPPCGGQAEERDLLRIGGCRLKAED